MRESATDVSVLSFGVLSAYEMVEWTEVVFAEATDCVEWLAVEHEKVEVMWYLATLLAVSAASMAREYESSVVGYATESLTASEFAMVELKVLECESLRDEFVELLAAQSVMELRRELEFVTAALMAMMTVMLVKVLCELCLATALVRVESMEEAWALCAKRVVVLFELLETEVVLSGPESFERESATAAHSVLSASRFLA